MTDTSSPTRPATPPHRTPLVGRERELAILRTNLEIGLFGEGRVLLLSGEPGIGKTRIAEELASDAAARGALVLWGRSHEAEWTPPYWPWVQVLRAYAQHRPTTALRTELGAGAADIAQLVPEIAAQFPDLPPLPTLSPEQARFRAFDHVAVFLQRAAAAQPLVLILDDLHWADAPSLLLLEFMARETRDAPLVTLGTYRDVEIGRQHPLARTVAELVRAGRSQRVTLRGLSQADVGRLVAADGVAPTADLVAAVYDQTEGNPFFVHEIAQLLASEAADGRERSGRQLPIPQSVREAVGRRLDRLTPECNDILATAAAIGREFGLPVLSRAGEQPSEHILAALEEATTTRLIEEVPRRVAAYRFAHALIRDTLYDELSTVQRVRLHRRIGQALEIHYGAHLDRRLAELAHHFVQAAPGGDVARAIDYASRAGDWAMALLAYEDAAAHYESALQVIDLMDAPDETRRCGVLLALGEAQRSAGDPAFRTTFERAADLAKTLRAPELLGHASLGAAGQETALFRADPSLVRLLDEALSALEPADAVIRTRVLARLALELALEEESLDRATVLSEEAVAAARLHGEPELLARTLHARYTVLCGYPDALDAAFAVATEMTEVADRSGNRELSFIAHGWRVFVPLIRGEIETVTAEIDTCIRLADELRQPYQIGLMTGTRGSRALIAGRFEEGERFYHEHRAIMDRLRGRSENLWGYVGAMFFLRREQGRLAEFEPILTSMLEQFPTYPTWRAIRVQLAIESGRHDEARDELERFAASNFAALHGHGVWIDYWLDAVARLAEVCAESRALDHAPTLYDMLLPFASRNVISAGHNMWCGAVARYLGQLAAILGRWEEADQHFRDALAINARIGAPPLVARTQLAYARMLLDRDNPEDREQARTLASEALATARAIGMTRLTDELRALLEQMAGHSTERGPGADALEGLTKREIDVLRLLVAGRSNPEIAESLFISRATARTHVGNILAKFGVHARAEVIDYARRTDLLNQPDPPSTSASLSSTHPA
jgi:DNA-binding CsgD family transcriptional regulator